MPVFNEHVLHKFAPRISSECLKAFLVPNADDLLIEAGITSALVLQHFMGQMYVESGGFTTLSENLHYSADRLRKVFPRKFHSIESAAPYANNPVSLANYVYGGRMGNNKPGDGWKYRGGGLIQLTGSDNYRSLGRKIGIDLWNHPDLIRDPQTALQIAAQFFKCSRAVEAAENDDGRLVTYRVNGGYNGEADREVQTRRATTIFVVDPVYSGNIHSTAPRGLLAESENVDEDAPDQAVAPAAAPLRAGFSTIQDTSDGEIKMTRTQAKQLQQLLKEKNYSPGDINGDIHNATTVGAICCLQKQEGLPVTGIVDEATEDAIQNGPEKVVSDNRDNETAASLKAKGSQTIAAADNIELATHGVSIGGVSTAIAGAGGIVATVNDQADQLTKITDHVPGLSEKLALFVTNHLGYIGLTILGAILIFIALHLYRNNRVVVSERVNKSRTGRDTSC